MHYGDFSCMIICMDKQQNWKFKKFDDLSLNDLYDILQLRSRIFVVEQNAIYLDADGLDKAAHHLLFRTDHGQLVAYCRLLPPGSLFTEAAIGRVVVDPDFRGLGLAREMLRQAIPMCLALYQVNKIHISAQRYLHDLYASFGFQAVTADYLEDGILHVGMDYNSGTRYEIGSDEKSSRVTP